MDGVLSETSAQPPIHFKRLPGPRQHSRSPDATLSLYIVDRILRMMMFAVAKFNIYVLPPAVGLPYAFTS
jgi:hypothetical protein